MSYRRRIDAARNDLRSSGSRIARATRTIARNTASPR
jgi:hypothetical protein